MNIYNLPIDLSTKIDIDDIADMSDLRFPCEQSKQKRSSFLFLRNTGLKMNLSFDKCSFNDKEEFLLLYLQGNVNVYIKELIDTWMQILFSRYNEHVEFLSILNKKEIDEFLVRNQEFIYKLYNFIISIPVCTIKYYMSMNDGKIEDDIPDDDYDEINIENFMGLVSKDQFIALVEPIDGMIPKFYTKYFTSGNNMMVGELIKRFPYLDLMNVLMSTDNNVRDRFSDEISSILNE